MRKCKHIRQQFTWLALLPICLAIVVAGNAEAQTSAIAPSNPLSRDRNGWQLYNVNASFGYSTLALPVTGVANNFSLGRLESDYDGTASASFGYNYTGAKTSVSMLYSPSVVGRVRYSQVNSLNQSLGLTVSRKLGLRWNLSVALGGADTTLDQMLFTPAVLSTVTAPVTTTDDLLGAIRGGQYTSDQVASILTGTPYVATPSRSIIYGSKYLSTSLTSTATYRYTPRLSIAFTAGAVRSQTRNRQENSLQTVQNFLIPRTTTEQGSASLQYALSPRTDIGLRGTTSHIDSSFGRYMVTNAEVLLNHKINAHWIASVSGGPAHVKILQIDPRFLGNLRSSGAGYTAQGNLGYALGKRSTLMASYGKTAGDTYGFGSQSSESLAGSWQHVLPGRSWRFYAGGGFQRLNGGAFGDFQYWHGNAGFFRTLSRQVSMSLSFGYVNRKAIEDNFTPLQQNLNGFSTRVTLVWSPFGREETIPGMPAGSTGVSR